MKVLNKILTASVISLMFAGAASADSIYLNLGDDYNNNNSDTTAWFDELDIDYMSNTVVTDADASFDFADPATYLSVGDTTVTNVGMSIGTTLNDFDGTHVTNLGGMSSIGYDDNDFGVNNWGITFGITDLQGVITEIDGDVLSLAYQAATIEVFMYDYSVPLVDGNTDISAGLTHVFDLNMTFGGDTGNSTVLKGNVTDFYDSFNGVAASDIFNIAYGNGELTFGAASILDGGLRFLVSNDTEGAADPTFNQEGKLILAGQHDGSIDFSVPEPTSLAILGLGLLGFAGTRRRKA